MAEHIAERLHIQIKPEDVRLVPAVSDLYRWQIVNGKEHLFKQEILKKQLSRHSVNAYRHLLVSIGVTLEAVAQSPLTDITTVKDTDTEYKLMEERICDLVKSNDILQTEVNDLKSQMALAGEEQKQSRAKAIRLHDDLQTLEIYNQKLKDKLQEWVRTLTYLRNTIMRSGEDCVATLVEELQVVTTPL